MHFRLALAGFALAITAAPSPSQERQVAGQPYREETITLSDGALADQTFRYRLHVPQDVREGERLPVVLFLHGAGERGSDNRRQLQYLPKQLVREPYKTRYRCIVVAPQCPRGVMWMDFERRGEFRGTTYGPQLDVAWAALQKTLAEHPCDPDRVYLTGLSMGGYGSWHLAAKHPEAFAAVAPVCGGGDTRTAKQLVDLPIWAWHGLRDRTVPPSQSLDMVRAVRAAGGIAHYRALPGVPHNSWSRAYGEGGLLDWLFDQRRGRKTMGRVIACDQSGPRLLILELDRPWTVHGKLNQDAVVWEFTGENLPKEQRPWFSSCDEAKPVDDGTALLVTASGGGFFKIRIADKKVLFAAKPGGNPHSAAQLPDGSFVVASSTGDKLTHYSADSGSAPLGTFEVADAHGAAWDDGRHVLWVLGGKELVSFHFTDRLEELSRVSLPVTPENQKHPRHGGHDLTPLADGRYGKYLVTDMERVFVFDPSAEGASRFQPFDPLPEAAHVKAIGAVRPGGPWVGLAATKEWWSDRLLFVPSPEAKATLSRSLPGGRVYKFRPLR